MTDRAIVIVQSCAAIAMRCHAIIAAADACKAAATAKNRKALREAILELDCGAESLASFVGTLAATAHPLIAEAV